MKLFIGLLFLFVVAACKQSPKIPENFDYGKIENGVYSNSYFNFEIPVPGKWVVQSKEQVEQIKKAGQDLIAEKNKDIASMVKASEVRSAILLTAFKNRADTFTGQFNSSFMILSENLGSISGIKTGKDYLQHAKNLMQQSGMSYQFPSGFYSEKVGNREFDVMDVVMTVKETEVQQSYYSVIDKKFALNIIISFIGDEQKKELINIINNIRFK